MHGVDKQKTYCICFGNGYLVPALTETSIGPVRDSVFTEDEKSVFWINTDAGFVMHHHCHKSIS